MSKRMNKERAIEILKLTQNKIQNIDAQSNKQDEFLQTIEKVIKDFEKKEIIQALDIAIKCIDHEEKCNKAINDSTKAIAEMERLCAKCQVDNEWVDVRDRLPSESGYYLVSIKGVKETTTWFYGVSRYGHGWDEFEGHEDIIAWKPLPEPYERKE